MVPRLSFSMIKLGPTTAVKHNYYTTWPKINLSMRWIRSCDRAVAKNPGATFQLVHTSFWKLSRKIPGRWLRISTDTALFRVLVAQAAGMVGYVMRAVLIWANNLPAPPPSSDSPLLETLSVDTSGKKKTVQKIRY